MKDEVQGPSRHARWGRKASFLLGVGLMAGRAFPLIPALEVTLEVGLGELEDESLKNLKNSTSLRVPKKKQ